MMKAKGKSNKPARPKNAKPSCEPAKSEIFGSTPDQRKSPNGAESNNEVSDDRYTPSPPDLVSLTEKPPETQSKRRLTAMATKK